MGVKLEAFIFDMDGVMLDSEPLQLRSFNEVLKPFGVSISMPEFKKNYMGLRDTQICEKIVSDFNLSLSTDDFVEGKRSAYRAIIEQEGVASTVGLEQAVRDLHAMFPLGIASSSSIPEIETITKRFGIRDFFKTIVSAHQVKNGKPAPDVYLKASGELGVPPSACGVIEDTKTGVRSAKAAGMFCVGITTTHMQDELNEADAVVSSLRELVEVVANRQKIG